MVANLHNKSHKVKNPSLRSRQEEKSKFLPFELPDVPPEELKNAVQPAKTQISNLTYFVEGREFF